jgi:hypothetical protein
VKPKMPKLRIVVDGFPLVHAWHERIHDDQLLHLAGKLSGVCIFLAPPKPSLAPRTCLPDRRMVSITSKRRRGVAARGGGCLAPSQPMVGPFLRSGPDRRQRRVHCR